MAKSATQTFSKVEQVPLTQLKPHPMNARRGNVDMIAESLSKHGQIKPIVVNTLPPLENVIVAGHHTVQGAEQNGWTSISVAWVSLTEDEHVRVMLMDNKSNDSAENDNQALLDLLDSLNGDLAGTGFTEADQDRLILLLEPEEPDDLASHLSAGSVSSYTLVFDNEGQLNDWNGFLRMLRKMDMDSDYSVASRVLGWLDERGGLASDGAVSAEPGDRADYR